jgi:uncharacterized membrane protein YvlD (DUF360 family)
MPARASSVSVRAMDARRGTTLPGTAGGGSTPFGRRPRPTLLSLAAAWAVSAAALLAAAAVMPGVDIPSVPAAFVTAALIAVLNVLLPPLVAAVRLPYTLALGFILILLVDAAMFWIASEVRPSAIQVDSFLAALGASLVAAAVGIALTVLLGTGMDDVYAVRLAQRIARRQGQVDATDVPGIVFLEIDGLGLPVLKRAMRDGNAPNLARLIEDGRHRLLGWETDLSSQTGASQAGILLGSNEDIPAFRWVEKESGRLMTCSAPPDCAEIERRHAGSGLLAGGGTSRGNLLSGEAGETILTVSRMDAEREPNPGYRAFFANGSNVTRALVLFFWEIVLEWTAALRARRRDVRPRGHRGGIYPLIRAGMCIVVRDLIVFGVLTDMMRGRPAVYATFSSYDEVAHHSGLERADTLEALRKLDTQLGRLVRAVPFAARPYEIVVLSDHGQTQGATFRQRNGYGLNDLVQYALENGNVSDVAAGDEHDTALGQAIREAAGRAPAEPPRKTADLGGRDVVVLGSGNLGLVYLMGGAERMTMEEIDERHPRLLPALREHPHVGFVLVHSAEHGPVALGAGGAAYLAEGRVDGQDPLAGFSPNAARHLRRTDAFAHAPDILVNSFYDPDLDQGCAFEELISFHGGLGGPQTQAFVLAPVALPAPSEPIVGAAALHDLLSGWRRALQGTATIESAPPEDRPQPVAGEV